MKEVLIAEEDEVTCKFIRGALSDKYNVNVVRDTNGVLERCKYLAFDLVIIDTSLSGVSENWEVLAEIKRLQPTVKIILMAWSGQISKEDAIKSGADQLIRKPFSDLSRFAKYADKLTRS